jgi:thiol-disulfide isomerase/thioredoxin
MESIKLFSDKFMPNITIIYYDLWGIYQTIPFFLSFQACLFFFFCTEYRLFLLPKQIGYMDFGAKEIRDMAKNRALLTLASGILMLASGGVLPAQAQKPTPEQILDIRPKQPGIHCSAPGSEEIKQCEVRGVRGSRKGSGAWLLLDPKGLPLRRIFDSDGDRRPDVWSYYKDGLEVYREVDSKKTGRPDHFRWFNAGGMKWGVDEDGDGKIDHWNLISAEEVAREVYQAAVDNDFHRLQALFITERELQALPLPAAQADKIRTQLRDSGKKFKAALEKMPNIEKSVLVRVESATPQCVPAETAGAGEDVIHYPFRSVLYQTTDKKYEWLQTGEIIKVGASWRLLDAPSISETATTPVEPKSAPSNPELQGLLDKLAKLDEMVPQNGGSPGPNAEMVNYYLGRAKLVEQIVSREQDTRLKETFYNQLLDNLSAAAQYSEAKDTRAFDRLRELVGRVVNAMPGSNLAAYGTFQLLWAEYGPKISGNQKKEAIQQAQEEWLERLVKFVETYPNARITPEALYHLGMGNEFAGRDEQAKRWYHELASHFQNHPLAPKAAGAERRLGLAGKEIELSSPMLSGGSYDVAKSRGKLVAVYFWASHCSTCVTDFARLKQLQSLYGAKGFELVMINLDDQREMASQYLRSNPIDAIHLFQEAKEGGGFNSPLALQFGIQGLPTLFLVGRDGKVLQRSLQVADLEDAIKKAL